MSLGWDKHKGTRNAINRRQDKLLKRLTSGQTIIKTEMANIYGVSCKTIQRDINAVLVLKYPEYRIQHTNDKKGWRAHNLKRKIQKNEVSFERNCSDQELINVILYVSKEISDEIAKNKINSTQEVEWNKDHSLHLSVNISLDFDIISFIQKYLPYVYVESPDEIRNQIIKNLTKYLERYS